MIQVHLFLPEFICKLSCMIDVRRLRVLRELADQGTVTAAAAALRLTPSAVSQQLAALTREAGVPLVEPHGRRLRLTAAGHVLLDHAHRVFAQLEQAEADLRRHSAGDRRMLRVGGFPTAIASLIAPVVGGLQQAPEPLTLEVFEVDGPESFLRVAAGELDLVVAVETPSAPQRDDPRYFRRPVFRDELFALVAADHPAAGRREVPLEELAGEQWVIGNIGSTCFDIVQAACSSAGFTPRATHHTSDWPAVGALVAAGGWVALAPRLALAQLPDGVRTVPIEGRAVARHVFVATRRGSEGSPAIARVLAELVAVGDALGSTGGRRHPQPESDQHAAADRVQPAAHG
jgi:DNA-binding transcriptional LysR family regulator